MRLSNKLFLILGESASGKDSIMNILLDKISEQKLPIKRLVSHTTRPKRDGETDEYIFDNNKQLLRHTLDLNILESAEYLINNYELWNYYTLKSDLNLKSQSMVKIINPIGYNKIKEIINPKYLVTIHIDCPEHIRKERYENRCDTLDKWENRLQRDKEDFDGLEFDYTISNDGTHSLESRVDAILAIIKGVVGGDLLE